MEAYVIELLEKFSYGGMLFLIMLENVFPPIPSEVILTFGGFMLAHTKLSMTGMFLASVTGSVIGAAVLYFIGSKIPIDKLDHVLANKWVRKLGFKEGDIKKTLGWFDRHENLAVLLCRFVPVVRSLISIPAGMARMPFVRFLGYTALGSGIWNMIFLTVGKKAGDNWHEITEIFDRYSNMILAVAAVILVIYFLYKKKKTNKNGGKRSDIMPFDFKMKP